LPIGASSINNDLREFLRIPKKDIDLLKRRYGAAVAENVAADIAVPVKTTGHAKKQILQRNIAEIAEERLKDIAGFIMRELKASKLSATIPCGVILTGGSAYLADIEELLSREMNMEVRLGHTLNGLDDESQEKVVAFPQSVVLGLLLYGAQHEACETSSINKDESTKSDNGRQGWEETPAENQNEGKPLQNPQDVEKEPIPENPAENPTGESIESPTTPQPEDPAEQGGQTSPKEKEDGEDTEQKPEEKGPEKGPKREPKESFMEKIRKAIDGIFNSDDQYL
jgi:cell division protein FtsA